MSTYDALEQNKEYLRAYLSRTTGWTDESKQLLELQRLAFQTNHAYVTMMMFSGILAFILFVLFSMALHSTWAADHLARSGRGWLTSSLCYLELYLPVLCLIFVTVTFVGLIIVETRSGFVDNPPELPSILQVRITRLLLWSSWLGSIIMAHYAIITRRQWQWRLVPAVVIASFIGLFWSRLF